MTIIRFCIRVLDVLDTVNTMTSWFIGINLDSGFTLGTHVQSLVHSCCSCWRNIAKLSSIVSRPKLERICHVFVESQ